MWRLAVYTVLTLILFAAPNPAPAAEKNKADGIKWMSYDKAQAHKGGERKFFIYFHADWCGYCHKLKKKAFADADIIAYLNANYISIRVDTDNEQQLAARFGVQGLPDLRILTSDGKNIARWPGYIEKDHLLNLLQYVHTDSFDKMSFRDFVKQN